MVCAGGAEQHGDKAGQQRKDSSTGDSRQAPDATAAAGKRKERPGQLLSA